MGHYTGSKSQLFWLALRTSLLTLLTLGLYRFWAKTRIRRHIWSSTSFGGDALEYTGTGLEKFLGFLLAIVILAIYLGIVQMALFFAGFTVFVEPTSAEEALAQFAALYLSIFAVLPLLYFAQYRARRYRMARTRWRGVRLGMENGAWGYVWRALCHLLVTILTLGLLLPRQTFYLEKYMADRTWYGDARMVQHGRWQRLYPAMKHLIIGAVIAVAGPLLGTFADSPVLILAGGFIGWIWFACGMIHYRVESFKYLWVQKTLGEGVRFRSNAVAFNVLMTIILGTLIVSLIIGVIAGVGAFFLAIILGAAALSGPMIMGPAGIIAVVLYIALLLLSGALTLIYVTQPIVAHIVDTFEVHGAAQLDDIRQREADQGADAEGFADALDVGGAF